MMEENSVGFSVITTAAGVLLATVLTAVLGFTLFMWADTSAGSAAEADSDAVAMALQAETEAAPAATDVSVADAGATSVEDAPRAETDAAAPVATAPEAVSAALSRATCTACHVIPGVANANGIVGPSLAEIGTVAATRVAGQSAEEYIRTSIMQPEDFIVSDCPSGACPAGVMLPVFGQMLSEDELNGVVDYLLTLHGE